MKPFLPHYSRDGNVVISRETVRETDRLNNPFDVTYVIYRDKKGKEHRDVARVVHLERPHETS